MEDENNILEKWEDCPLSDCVKIIGGGTPKTAKEEYWNGNIPWLSVVDFNNDNRWVISTEKNITKLGLDESSTKLLEKGDVIVSARGTVGAMAQLKYPMAFNQSCYGIRFKENKTNEDFLYYILKHSIEKIKRNVHGAVFDTITRQTFDFINILLPPLPEQKAIAKVLTAFDDKIELLQAQNKTLETMAQTIFKEWFGKYQIGDELPEGWRFVELQSVIDIGSSKRIFASEYAESGIPFYRGKEITELSEAKPIGTEIFITQEKYDDLKLKYGVPKENDILLTSVGTIGNTYLVKKGDEFYFKDGNLTWIKEYKSYIDYSFIYEWLNSKIAAIAIEEIKIGSTQQAITISSLNTISLLIPSKNDYLKISEILKTNIKKRQENQNQIQSLTKTRDTLLPKLMSGQVRVKNIKQTTDA